MSECKLWTDLTRTRYFLLPDEPQLPHGDFAIHTVTGRKLAVDPEVLTSFEISEKEARNYLESELSKMLDGARGAVDRFIDRLSGIDADPLAPVGNAIESLENALSRYAFSHKSETEDDLRALHKYADRTMEIVRRIRLLAGK
jgi:hypothetical protein